MLRFVGREKRPVAGMRIAVAVLGAACMIATAPAWADVHYLSDADLPIVLGPSYVNDTVRISGTHLSTPGNGISIEADGVLLDLANDTLEFGTSFGDGLYGVRLGSSRFGNVVIRGGTIIHGGGVGPSERSDACLCLRLEGSYGLLVDGTNMVIRGVDGRCIGTTNYESNRMVEIRGGRYRHEGIGFVSREFFNGAVMKLEAPASSLAPSDFNWKIHDLVIEKAIHAGVKCGGVAIIYNCTIIVDARNDLYTYPQDNFAHGSANAGGIIMGGLAAGSEIHHNTVLADSNHAGFDVGLLMEDARGTAGRPIRIHSNYVEGHRGWDAHYGDLNCKGMKFRYHNKHVLIRDNTFKVKCDGNSATHYRGPGAHAMEALCVEIDAQLDSFITIENNLFEATDVDGGASEASAVRLQVETNGLDTWTGAGNVWRNNRLKSNRTVYNMANQYDHGCGYFLAIGDTATSYSTVYDFATFRLGRQGSRSVGNVFRDGTYLGHCRDRDIVFAGVYDEADIAIERTLRLKVRSENGLPISQATVTITNNYGRAVYYGQTDGYGDAAAPITYWYESNFRPDSTAFNPMHLRVEKDGDVVTVDQTVTASSGDRTVIMSGTSGDDPSSEGAIADLNLNQIPYEISDAVLYGNYFVYGLAVFTIDLATQIATTDVNQDGLTLSVADMITLIRTMVGAATPPAKLSTISAQWRSQNGVLWVSAAMGGVHVVVDGNVTPKLLAENMTMEFHAQGDRTSILVYSLVPDNSFRGDFLRIDGKVSSIEFATPEGFPVDARKMQDGPVAFGLSQNYPNPFNPVTTIEFTLNEAADYGITIYNAAGREVATFSGSGSRGPNAISWDASGMASGVYFYRLRADSFTDVKKMVLVK